MKNKNDANVKGICGVCNCSLQRPTSFTDASCSSTWWMGQ